MWVTRWRYEIATKPVRKGIWRLRQGGFLLRTRATDPRSGKEISLMRILRDASLEEAQRLRDQMKSDARDLARGRKRPSRTLWSEYAASLFEAKVVENKLKSAKTRELWATTLKRLVPAFGHFYVDELRYADIVEWRSQVALWIRDGMFSIRARDAGKEKLVALSPVTANGWISILKVICGAMRKHFELARDPADDIEMFDTPRTYTREQPNSLVPAQIPQFLEKLKELHPNHYAMTFLGFVIGARPSSLRPLRRNGSEPDLLWDEGLILLRRSNSLGKEIMDQTKTGQDQEIPLPVEVIDLLRGHVNALPAGAMQDSEYLFPSTKGGLRARTVLVKPFKEVLTALKWNIRLTPRGMRRTFQDLARRAEVHDIVTRAISGHATESMQRHYSTAQHDEMRSALGKVVRLLTSEELGVIRGVKEAG